MCSVDQPQNSFFTKLVIISTLLSSQCLFLPNVFQTHLLFLLVSLQLPWMTPIQVFIYNHLSYRPKVTFIHYPSSVFNNSLQFSFICRLMFSSTYKLMSTNYLPSPPPTMCTSPFLRCILSPLFLP